MLWGIFANFLQQEMNQWMECANESKRMYGVKCAEAVFHFFCISNNTMKEQQQHKNSIDNDDGKKT